METEQKVKSKLQEKLEAQGWTLLENVGPLLGKGILFGGSPVHIPAKCSRPRRDQELEKKYLKRFKKVKVTDAYDDEGNLIGSMRAIYVKDEIKHRFQYNIDIKNPLGI